MADQMADAMVSTVNHARVHADVTPLTDAVSEHVSAALTTVSGALAGLEARTRLLWWKESLWSPSTQTSYRTLPPPEAAAVMAVDLFDGVGLTAPAGVVALLSEAVRTLAGAQPHPVRDLLAAVPRDDLLLPGTGSGRVPLLALAGRGAFDDETIQRRTGVPVATRLTLPDWAAWIFRELLAAASIELYRSRQAGQA